MSHEDHLRPKSAAETIMGGSGFLEKGKKPRHEKIPDLVSPTLGPLIPYLQEGSVFAMRTQNTLYKLRVRRSEIPPVGASIRLDLMLDEPTKNFPAGSEFFIIVSPDAAHPSLTLWTQNGRSALGTTTRIKEFVLGEGGSTEPAETEKMTRGPMLLTLWPKLEDGDELILTIQSGSTYGVRVSSHTKLDAGLLQIQGTVTTGSPKIPAGETVRCTTSVAANTKFEFSFPDNNTLRPVTTSAVTEFKIKK